MKPQFTMFPTTMPRAWVMVTNVVGRQVLEYQYAVYEYTLPDNKITQWHGIYNNIAIASGVALNAAHTLDVLASALQPDGKW